MAIKKVKGWADKNSLENNELQIRVYLDAAVDARFIPVTISFTTPTKKRK